nr:CAP domain-containing protein [Paenibacillus hemerocallicola]
MKPYIALAALLLIAGCSSNNMTKMQQTPNQTKVETHAGNAAPTSTLRQASSTSTPGADNSSIAMQQAPQGGTNWMDWFNGAPANNAPNQAGNPQSPADSSQFAQQVLQLVNQERTKAGLQSLSMNDSLSNMAMTKAQDMYNNNYFDHQSPTYGSPFDMMSAFGITYNTAGENIAKGQTSPMEVMNQWMNSPGHRANILNSSFTQIGIAYYNSEWVQEFIG